jgi:hypothetical protein
MASEAMLFSILDMYAHVLASEAMFFTIPDMHAHVCLVFEEL